MHGIIYCRVSTPEQVENLSLATQERVCREYCRRNDIEVDEVFVEEGESAKTTSRPAFQRMLAYCREHKHQIQFVIVYSLTRFSRRTEDHAVTRVYLRKFGVELRSATEAFDESPAGTLMENILASFGQFDNDVRKERTIAGMKAAVQIGRFPHKAPIGYLNRRDGDGKPSLIPDPERAPLIRRAFELFATGRQSKEDVRKMVTALGLTTPAGKVVSTQTFDRLLRNDIYAGWVVEKRWKERVRGGFAPLIDDEKFDHVQAVLSGRRPVATPYVRNHPDFPLRMFVRCGKCSKPLTGAWSTGRSKKYAYYRCPDRRCRGVNVRKDELDIAFLGFVDKLRPKPEFIEKWKNNVMEVWEAKQTQAAELERTLTQRVEKLKERKMRLVDALLDKELTQDIYQERMDKLAEELALAEMELGDAKVEETDIEGMLNYAQFVVTNASYLWLEADLAQRQRLQRILYPDGVTFLDGEFGTTTTCLLFNQLAEIEEDDPRVASPEGFEPALPP
jgi:DNA invertase Pin-like site-specific DNA recombinase